MELEDMNNIDNTVFAPSLSSIAFYRLFPVKVGR